MRFLLLVIPTLISFCLPLNARAGALDSVAVVDVERIFSKAKAVQDIRDYFSKKDTEYKKMLSGFESALIQKQQDLKAKEGKISAEEFALERNKIEKQVLESRNKLKALNKKASKSLIDAENQVRHEAMRIIGEISKERNFDMIFPAQSLVQYSHEKFDITEEALKRLNKSLPKIELKEK